MEKEKYISRQIMNTLINEYKVSDNELDSFFNDFKNNGYVIEGYNEPKPTMAGKIVEGLSKRVSNVSQSISDVGNAQGALETVARAGAVPLRAVGQAAGAVGDVIGGVVGKGLEATGLDKPLAEGIQKVAETAPVKAVTEAYGKLPQEIKSPIEDITNIATTYTGGNVAKAGVKGTANVTEKVGANISKNVSKKASKTKDILKESVNKNLFPLDTPENIKTSLNPFLTDTKADISVPTQNGYVLKKIDQITPEEKIAVQRETSNLYSEMFKKAKEFKTDRRDTFSAIDIVGNRTDKALDDVNNLRKQNGSLMGEIEKNYQSQLVDLKGTRLNTFVDEYLGGSKKFGRTMKDTTFMDDFAKDYDKLSKNPSIKDSLEFTRTWQKELEDLKDGFGNFKDNKRTYSLIEGAINDIKNGARNLIAQENPEYQKALSNYKLTSTIKEEGNRLMGKEGLAGEKVKGGALAKRAVQSSSDQGARQFYNVLKKVTGYDGIKEADVALQAMKDAGDYQGLSLLEVQKDLYEATAGKILSKVPFGEATVDIAKAVSSRVMPSEKRVKNLVDKLEKGAKITTQEKSIIEKGLQAIKAEYKKFEDMPNKQGGFIKLPTASKVDDISSSIQKAKAEGKSFDEWVKGQKDFVDDTKDYAMSHRPTEGPRAFNLTEKVDGEQMIPQDMYQQWYGSRGDEFDKESIAVLKKIKDNPEAEVTIYRASPTSDFNYGDWVSLSKKYAKQHAESNGDKSFKVNELKVKAKDVRWAMDDVNEFGYYPENVKTRSQLKAEWDKTK